MQDMLVLRDIHQPPAPPWWPPAPGWWGVLAVLVLVAAVMGWRLARRRQRRRAIITLFEDALAREASPAGQVAAMSELLRRAARRRDATADRLQGEDWLRFLDGDAHGRAFSDGAGRLLLEGPFRRDVHAEDVAALVPLARARFLAWMGGR